jgi:hypothetical protein
MFWTLELASYLEEAPWPATKDELIDYSIRSGAPIEVVENLQELEDEGEVYESIEDIWPDYPSQEKALLISGISILGLSFNFIICCRSFLLLKMCAFRDG